MQASVSMNTMTTRVFGGVLDIQSAGFIWIPSSIAILSSNAGCHTTFRENGPSTKTFHREINGKSSAKDDGRWISQRQCVRVSWLIHRFK
jgi:hypothetical protein